jgi:hypothetical protein
MNAQRNYLRHVLRHKWLFAKEGLKLGVSVWRILVHDLDKFYPSEWGAHVRAFGSRGVHKYHYTPEFFRAMLLHRHRNPHHWQHWILLKDDGEILPLAMDDAALLEMFCDWRASARARGGDVREWWSSNQAVVLLHPDTRAQLEELIRQ